MSKNIKNRYFLFLIFIIIFLFLNIGFSHALEVSYPNIPGLPNIEENCTGKDCFAKIVSYWFGVLIYIAGIISLISFTMGAIGLMNPSVEAHSDAKDRMKGAILGLVIAVTSFLIIKQIDIRMITLTITPVPGVVGVFYTNGEDNRPAPKEESDVSNRPEGFDQIKYLCTTTSEEGPIQPGPPLLIWKFPKTNFSGNDGGYSGVKVERIECGDSTSVSGGSFKTDFETPGIYYCLEGCGGNTCGGYMSASSFTASQDQVPDPFKGKEIAIRIVNDPANNINYGAILHQSPGLDNGGICSPPITNADCHTVDIPVFAIDIFRINNAPTSGSGVSFYSEPFGWKAGQDAGAYSITNADLQYRYQQDIFQEDAAQMCFSYAATNRPNAYIFKCEEETQCHEPNEIPRAGEENGIKFSIPGVDCSSIACESFRDCPGSISVKGNYLIGLYSEKSDGESGGSASDSESTYCQTFTKDVVNLKQESIRADTGENLGKIYVIPTK